MIAQIDKQDAAMVADPVAPSRDTDVGANIGVTEGSAGV
jgi:hypothetical protein